MPSKQVADVTHLAVLTGAEEFHLVAGVVRDGGGNVTNHGDSRHVTVAELATFILAGATSGITQAFADGRYLQKASNLADVGSAATARTNLGLGSAATFAATAFLQASNNLSDVPNVATARANLGVYSSAQVDALVSHKYELFGALPLAATFTAVSAANMTLTDGNRSMAVFWTASGVNQVQLEVKAAPATPYDVCMRLRPALTGVNVQFGIVLRNSGTGKFIIFSVDINNNIYVQEWTNPSTFSSTVIAALNQNIFWGSSPGWLRVHSDGTTLTFYYSPDGDLWIQFGTRTIATFLGSIDQYGFGAVCQSAAHVFISSFGAALPT